MKKRVIIGFIILLLIFIIVCIFVKVKKNSNKKEIEIQQVNYIEETEKNEDNEEKIIQMAENQGLEADKNIYEMATEYDGREIITIKANVKYKVALAGAIKKEIPEFSEIDEILNKAPTHTGIWVEENSRATFLKSVKNIANANYEIDKDGFLIQTSGIRMNVYDKSIETMLLSKNLYVFDICSTTYIVDEVTGEIQEYPFEEMDPYNGYEYFEDDNKSLFVISENKSGKVNLDDILREIWN